MSDFLTSLGQQALATAGQFAGQAIQQVLPQSSGVSTAPPSQGPLVPTVPATVAMPQQYVQPQYLAPQAIPPQPAIPQAYLAPQQYVQQPLVQQPVVPQPLMQVPQPSSGTTTGTTAQTTEDVYFEEDTFSSWASRNVGWVIGSVAALAVLIWIASGTSFGRSVRSRISRKRRKGATPTTIVVENNLNARGHARRYLDPSRLRIVRV